VTERFDADWLTLREPFDHAARSVTLAQRLADRLPRRPRLLDLGAGTGSLFRFLAPIIGRGQDWILMDADDALLEDAFGRTAAWARRQGFAATWPGDALHVSTPRGLWRLQAVQSDLGASSPPPQAGEVDGIVCSALLDLVSPAWLARRFDALDVPLLACLSVDGRDAWAPAHPADALVHAAFRRDQLRDKGFGPALGSAAPSVALKLLAARGFVTASAPSDWRIPRAALRMQRAMIDGMADAARNARPARAATIAEWQEARLRQAMRARLAIRIGHRDILALPPGG
jgi:SAM-dependent methyltransferase